MARLRFLRILVVGVLVLLALQFELGMAVNLSPSLQEVPPLATTFGAVWGALAKVGGDAVSHALLGTLLIVVALAHVFLAVTSGSKSVSAIGVFCFLGMALATVNGVLFTLSGFKNDNYSHGMATTFLVTFTLHFIQLCVLAVKLRRRAVA